MVRLKSMYKKNEELKLLLDAGLLVLLGEPM